MHEHDVPSSKGTTGSLSFGGVDEVPVGESFVGSYGRIFDVIVMNRPDTNSPGLYNIALESGPFESGRPVLLSPPSPPRQLATNVLISWNGCAEQTRTIALAIPLQQKADHVTLGCDLLIAYTQSRLRQIFGGATQYVLANAPLPVLLAH